MWHCKATYVMHTSTKHRKFVQPKVWFRHVTLHFIQKVTKQLIFPLSFQVNEGEESIAWVVLSSSFFSLLRGVVGV